MYSVCENLSSCAFVTCTPFYKNNCVWIKSCKLERKKPPRMKCQQSVNELPNVTFKCKYSYPKTDNEL